MAPFFIPALDSNWGYSGFFHDQNNMICQVHVYCGLSTKMREMRTTQKDCGQILFVSVFLCGRQNLKIPTPPVLALWLTTPLHGHYVRSWFSLKSVGGGPLKDT